MGDSELVVASPEEIGAGIGEEAEQRGNAGEKEFRKSPSIRAPLSLDDANDEQQKEPEPEPEPEHKQQQQQAASDDVEDGPEKTLMPIRAPVSVDPDEDAGNGSAGSGESFDSALERIAGSSTASFDTAASPKAGPDESETARVMPKAMLTDDDKHGNSNATSSGSESGEPEEEDNDNEDEGGASSVADNEEVEEDQEETYDDASALGLRVLGAEPEEAHDDHQSEAEQVAEGGESGDNDDKRDQDGVQEIKQTEGDSPELEDRHPQGAEPEEKDVEQEGELGEPEEKDVEQEGELDEPKEKDVEQETENVKPAAVEAEAPELERGEVADELPQNAASNVEEDASRVEEPEEEAAVLIPGEVKEESSAEADHSEEPAAREVPEEEAVQEETAQQISGDREKPEEVAASQHEPEKESGNQEQAPAAPASTNVAEEIAQEPDKDAADESKFPESSTARGAFNAAARVEEPADDEDSDEDDDAEDGLDLAALRAAREPDEKPSRNGAPSLGSAGPSLPAKPTASARSLPSLESAPRASQTPAHNPTTTTVTSASDNPATGESNDENNETREKLQDIRVKFLRLANRLGQSAHNVVVAQVLYRLGLAEQLRGGRASRNNAFSFERANVIAEELEASGEEELDFACTIMVLGKSGVGKSATINSLFDEVKTETNAFTFATKSVKEITGTVHGIKLRVIDTPGLLPAVADQRHNERIMSSVKRFIKKSPPDIVLYFDRLDMQNRDYGDLPLLRTITDTFGAAIWFNAIVVLTHASTAPPDGPNGLPLSYEMFVAQRSHVVQQTIRQAAGDMRLMNPVSLVENHSACRTNRAGERVLPNGQIWKPQLLLLCFASKILAEANSLLKLQESTPGKPFSMRSKVPPLPFLLSSLLQSRTPLKMPDEGMNDDEETDDDMDVEESDGEEEYDDLPPFRRLTKDEVQQLDKKNRAAYFEELRERERLFQKKQWKEELRRRKEMKRRGIREFEVQQDDGYDDDGGKSAAVPVPMPDMALPPTFDSDNPTHRYRYLETANQWLVRPVLETHGWDHDSGYDGLNVEKVFVLPKRIPASISGQITKDKKEANVTMECAASLKHGEGKFTQLGLDAQTVGKDMSYTIRSETRFNNLKKNKTIAGLALTMLGDTLAGGMKLEDRFMLGKRLKVVLNGGALTGKGEVAYGGTMEICLRDKDFPIGRTLTTLGFSVMNWHGDLAVGGNLQSQFMVGRTMVVARGNLNNRGAGTITVKASSSEQLQMALVGLVPLVRAIVGHRLLAGSSHQS